MVSGIIFDIKKFAIHDGPGIRTTVFFKGCPLKCWWCHNPESQNPTPQKYISGFKVNETIGRIISVKEVFKEVEKDIIYYDESGGGVTFSGGEPFMQPKFLAALLSQAKLLEINTVVDTSGYVAWKLIKSMLSYIDFFLYDLKLFDSKLHYKYIGIDNSIILGNLKKLLQLMDYRQNINIRIPIIPTITDTSENLTQIRDFLIQNNFSGKINLLPYNPLGERKYEDLGMYYKLGYIQPPSSEKMEEIRDFFLERFNQCIIGG
ncbi:MAG: glycyl-radical enzyme activating protein [Candidatus Lokiarchaeota archaeon]|nr:glycyl-radical enzyme activating protein [Candidatus Harpocratesius repetitus]